MTADRDLTDEAADLVPVDAGSLLDEAQEIIDADLARCPAATGHAVSDYPDRCQLHTDGAHRCHRGPRHQAEHRDMVPVIVARSERDIPEFATHECDDGFRWASITQQPAARYRSAADRDRRHAGLGLMCLLCHGPCTIDGDQPAIGG